MINGSVMSWLTKIWRISISSWYFLAKCHGTSIRKKNVTTFCHIIKNWQITFQASKLKGNHFLNLLDNELHTIEPLYTKRDPWIKQFGHLNSLCARAMRATTNHASIGEHYLRFFLRESFSCPCRVYPIEIRRHILYEYRRCIKY